VCKPLNWLVRVNGYQRIVRVVTYTYSFCNTKPSIVEDGFFLIANSYDLAGLLLNVLFSFLDR